MTPSPAAREIARLWPRLTTRDLLWLRDNLGSEGPLGVREPRHPRGPLGSPGVALETARRSEPDVVTYGACVVCGAPRQHLFSQETRPDGSTFAQTRLLCSADGRHPQ